MPPEGPNKADELLQRYAKERRAQSGDFSLHPATRRLLQGEVARQFKDAKRDASAGRWAWLGLWRGRFIATASFAIVGFLCWMAWDGSRNRERQMEFAQSNVEADSSLQKKHADSLAGSDML